MISIDVDWEKRYADKATPWDVKQPEAELAKLLDNGLVKPCRALELGCGNGNDSIYLAKKGFDVTGVDVSKLAIEEAKRRAKESGVKVNFIAEDASELKSTSGKFDFIYDRACFHFIPEEKREGYLQTVRKFLNKGGYFLLIASSDKDNVTGPYRFSQKDIRGIFEKDFEILDLRLITLEQHELKPSPYLCLMKHR